MGARERAKGRAARKGGGKDPSWSSKQSKTTQSDYKTRSVQEWQSFASTPYSSSPRNGFSMAQEARNTERHGLTWGNARLRDNAVSFVSAGNLVREDPQSSRSESPRPEQSEPQTPEEPTTAGVPADDLSVQELVGVHEEGLQELHANGTHADQPLPQDQKDSSASDSDEVIFQGRNTSAKLLSKPNSPPRQSEAQPLRVPVEAHHLATNGRTPHSESLSDEPNHDLHPEAISARPRRRWESRHERRRREEEEEEEAIMRDYIDNMALDEKDDDDEDEDEAPTQKAKPHRRNEHFRYHKGSGEQHAKVKLLSVQKTAKTSILPDETDDWESADLDDLNDLSTTDEDVPEVGRVLRHRERSQGKQYLVTAVGMEVSDAKWVSHSKLVSTTATEQIEIYEGLFQSKLQGSIEVSSSEDEELEDLIDDIGSEQDENERIIQQTSRMSDEQIARALAKQEELGMGGDHLMLFDGKEAEDMDDDDEDDMNLDEFMNGDDFIPFSLSKHTSNRGRSKRNNRGRANFPSASAFADALDQDPYGGFDIMDFDRPSLRPKRKGRKSDYPYDLEDLDEELAEQLMNTWTKDREKKAARKREKMEAQQALQLDSAEGSDPAVIKARIRQFLVSEADTLEMTPMDAPLRASVHRLAKSLSMNSKSHGKDGKGLGRYPVLTKTPYTPQYTVDNIWEVDALMNLRKFFPKNLYRSYKSTRPSGATPRRNDRGGVAAASYANGEVVGAAAPEIGQDNRGRAMLEKMGWSVGMGIGKEGNKGSVDSIKHVVKTNKAGLG
ncbi:uncharacterized protein HMPREF1541_09401 [Cyphellophora europaea CBS 101466]|uniref:G-patch domain-containing protein n=1 Tax=Cyphellophora europaea (strain CBS 101466) TaxID=1220924 RepID=W2SCB8_CYPE1|nr:uncharacterized protein HMPREF1541_09401 [Cyphellophora europaea CBS 101466]ETN45569.1 hypothetical protein HMPREF1541_09401 [Cyphellophora europaea CBS 101466]